MHAPLVSRAAFSAVLPLLVTRHRPPVAIADPPIMFGTSDSDAAYRPPGPQYWEQPEEHQLPEELMGPWELRSTLSGFESMWVDLDESGECSCSTRVGKGRRWSALQQPGGAWRLRFVVLDRLSRPLRWECQVVPDDVRGRVLRGIISGPPKRGSGAPDAAVKVGEFHGWPNS